MSGYYLGRARGTDLVTIGDHNTVVVREIRSLNLLRECARIRERGVQSVVIGCRTDTLVRCDQSRVLASALEPNMSSSIRQAVTCGCSPIASGSPGSSVRSRP